jgi:uncharacterized protein YxjI
VTNTPELLQRSGIGVHQRRKVFEFRNEYELVDEQGAPVGRATQERQGMVTLLARVFSDLDVMLPVELDVRDTSDAVVVQIRKPWFTWRVQVSTPEGRVGSITKQLRVGKARFALAGPNGEPVGEAHAQNWRARDFAVLDAQGKQVAKVTKEWRGLLTETITDADSYAIEFSPGLEGPLRVLAFATALAVDLVMKQKDSF